MMIPGPNTIREKNNPFWTVLMEKEPTGHGQRGQFPNGRTEIKDDGVTLKDGQHSLCAPRDTGHTEVETTLRQDPLPCTRPIPGVFKNFAMS